MISAIARVLGAALLVTTQPTRPGSIEPRSSEAPSRRRSPVVEVVERAGPAVVNIATEISQQSNPFRRRSQFDDVWREFFGEPGEDRGKQSLGSGVIIDPSGLVLTNEHVIARATNITITLADRRTLEVDVVGADPAFDLAVLKARVSGRLPSVDMGSSSDLMPGESVVAIGNPFGLANTVTLGVVSALHRSISAEDRLYEDFVQTDAAINPGNSGGALLNIEGKLIGINTAIYSGGTGIGFAIPIDKARAAVDEVLRYGEVRPAFTGIRVEAASVGGALVSSVEAKSPASDAGLRPGDLIVDVGGQEVRSGRAFKGLERGLVPGQSVRVSVLRGARRSSGSAPTQPNLGASGRRVLANLSVRELSFDRAAEIGRTRLGLNARISDHTLLITQVHPSTDAARVGIRKGDTLLSIGGRRLKSEQDFDRLCAAIRDADAVALVIGRAGRAYYVTLSLGPS